MAKLSAMDIDGQNGQQGEQPTLLPAARALSPTAERNARRRRLLEAQDFAQEISFRDPKVRFRWRMGMRDGSLHPSIEKALLDIGYGGASIDKRILAALATAGRGLTILLRKPLTGPLSEDPLAEPKKVGESSTVIEHPAQEPPALPLRSSIVPPARPKRAQGQAKLKPGEEELT